MENNWYGLDLFYNAMSHFTVMFYGAIPVLYLPLQASCVTSLYKWYLGNDEMKFNTEFTTNYLVHTCIPLWKKKACMENEFKHSKLSCLVPSYLVFIWVYPYP